MARFSYPQLRAPRSSPKASNETVPRSVLSPFSPKITGDTVNGKICVDANFALKLVLAEADSDLAQAQYSGRTEINWDGDYRRHTERPNENVWTNKEYYLKIMLVNVTAEPVSRVNAWLYFR